MLPGTSSAASAYPDLQITIEDVIAEGDKVVGRNSLTGTHKGDYMGLPPTRKSVTYSEIFIFRFAGGRIRDLGGRRRSLADATARRDSRRRLMTTDVAVLRVWMREALRRRE